MEFGQSSTNVIGNLLGEGIRTSTRWYKSALQPQKVLDLEEQGLVSGGLLLTTVGQFRHTSCSLHALSMSFSNGQAPTQESGGRSSPSYIVPFGHEPDPPWPLPQFPETE